MGENVQAPSSVLLANPRTYKARKQTVHSNQGMAFGLADNWKCFCVLHDLINSNCPTLCGLYLWGLTPKLHGSHYNRITTKHIAPSINPLLAPSAETLLSYLFVLFAKLHIQPNIKLGTISRCSTR